MTNHSSKTCIRSLPFSTPFHRVLAFFDRLLKTEPRKETDVETTPVLTAGQDVVKVRERISSSNGVYFIDSSVLCSHSTCNYHWHSAQRLGTTKP